MSELITSRPRADVRLNLLTTACTLALLTIAATAAKAEDASRPTVWIEAGWHFESLTGNRDVVVPPLDSLAVSKGFSSATKIQNILGRSYGAEGKISFQPRGSEWVFTFAGSQGRVRSGRDIHEEVEVQSQTLIWYHSPDGVMPNANLPVTRTKATYVDQKSEERETHMLLDFAVGKDLGVGLLGNATQSIVNFGVRYAQMNAKANGNTDSIPNAYWENFYTVGFLGKKYQIRNFWDQSASTAKHSSDFHGIGPSFSISNSTGLFGTEEEGRLALDWGVNAGLLFGRQRTRVELNAARTYYSGRGINPQTVNTLRTTRTHNVMVPNFGGFASLSYRLTNAKLSAGYRAEFFFGAMDRGLGARHSTTTGFHGPFATISIGLGD